jgi:phosphoglucomutase
MQLANASSTAKLAGMSEPNHSLKAKIAGAVKLGELLPSSANNIETLFRAATDDFYERVVGELAEGGHWTELNDRFYKTLAFGTGGLRGRTIGKIVAPSEWEESGKAGAGQTPPKSPCVGTNAMNFFNISRATQGLVAYLHEWLRSQKIERRPRLAIAHDTRFFSKDFTELAARVAAENGCDAFVFQGPRSTPELSFAVRYLGADAGVVITASHNPPHDNGYKVYFSDGAQVVEPQAGGIIARVNAIQTERSESKPEQQGGVTVLGEEIDRAYMERLRTLIINPRLLEQAKSLRIVYTPIHGTGGVIIEPLLREFGFDFEIVKEQSRFDGAFPTVRSPNPENAEALKMAIELANKNGADLVIATDPDCDRMGVAVRTPSGEMMLLTGNQIGSLVAYYRARAFFDRGILTKENAARGVLIKTFVTTDLQKAIAKHFGLRCVETLTGFKYIGAKLGKYEAALPATSRDNYVKMPEDETRKLRLAHSSFYVFGGEESYGYSGADFVRDKDGNGAAIMFCEVAAYAKSRSQTIDQLLDEIYSQLGYFAEKNAAMVFEGAEGAAKIARLVQSYAAKPPVEIAGSKIVKITNFETDTIKDVEGDLIPKEKMSIFELTDRTRIAVRGSGTEPKIKYYMFAQQQTTVGKFEPAKLSAIKAEVSARLEKVWKWLEQDAAERLGVSEST